MRAFITGITGFAGRHLTRHLLDSGDAVAGCSTKGRWTKDSDEQLRAIPLAPWDLSQPQPQSLVTFVNEFRPDVIYHLAALSTPADCGQQAPNERATAINVRGTAHVIELAAALPYSPKLLFVSSSHVYGKPSGSPPVVKEEFAPQPSRGYGMTKLEAEEVVLAAARRGLDAVIARPFQHTGPGQRPGMVLPDWARQFVLESDPIEVYSLDSHLDLSDVRDTVRAYRLLAGTPSAGGQIFNVGSGRSTSGRQVFELLNDACGQQRTARELQPGIKYEPIADISKLVEQTEWQPQISLETTVRDTLAYWQGKLVTD